MPTKKKPADAELVEVTRKGDVVTMPVATFDALVARILLAESNREEAKRSWWRP
jgi:hypothetical protein